VSTAFSVNGAEAMLEKQADLYPCGYMSMDITSKRVF
jgi:hypothetical protein